jgi:diguanylate cyclase (GGDEF)-like protein
MNAVNASHPTMDTTASATATAHEALMQFLYQAPIGLVQAARDGEILMINPMSAALLMPLAVDANPLNLFDLLAPVAPQLRALADSPALPGGVICDALRLVVGPAASPGGVPTTLAITLRRLDDATLMASLSDVTLAVQQEQARLASTLRDVSRIDSLTAMPNRAVVLERIEQALVCARADAGYRFAVLFINSDRFNRVNVTLGPHAGDELLRLMAERLGGAIRLRSPATSAADPAQPQQTAARLGGDEFVVLLGGVSDVEDVGRVAQRLVDTLCKPYRIDAQSVHATVSVGVVMCAAAQAQTGADADSVLQDASLAMREAKRAGGARCCLFEPALKERAWRRGHIESELRVALAEGQLFVVYQPIIDLANGLVTGAEALVRWRHPVRGIVPPVEFIEIAEETGLIHPLGQFVLHAACDQFARWQQQLGAAAPEVLSVNLSRAQLVDPTLVEQVRRSLQASGLAARHLQLEVTESLAAQDERIQSRLHELKALGLTLALDDFGTGYSSLASLHLLPVDVLKIDRSFVSQVESSAHHRVLVEATLRVARSLGMRTVAEGIETEGQADILAALQCDKGQGYLFARPMPADDATRWLMQRRSPVPQPRLEALAGAADPGDLVSSESAS